MKNIFRYIVTLLFACASFGSMAVAQTTEADSVANYDDQIMLISENETATDNAEIIMLEEDDTLSVSGSLGDFFGETGIAKIILGWAEGNWRYLVMIAVGCLLLYLAIVKQFEPLLLLPIAMGMILTNIPGAGMFHSELFAGGHVHWA